jgi:hypothetical protein
MFNFRWDEMQMKEGYSSMFHADLDVSINNADYNFQGSIQASAQFKPFQKHSNCKSEA